MQREKRKRNHIPLQIHVSAVKQLRHDDTTYENRKFQNIMKPRLSGQKFA